jgi:hypothetical protein
MENSARGRRNTKHLVREKSEGGHPRETLFSITMIYLNTYLGPCPIHTALCILFYTRPSVTCPIHGPL